MSSSQRLVTNLHTSGAHPHSYTSSGSMATPSTPTPAPPATPLPLSFLPTRLDFSKTKCDTAHHPQTPLHTNPSEENGYSCPVRPGPQARYRKTAQQTGTFSQQQAQDFNHAASKMGPLTCILLQTAGEPTGWQGTNSMTQDHPTWDRCLGALKIRFPLLCST